MMAFYYSTFLKLYSFYILFHFQVILSNSELLNYIIRLGDKNYRYNHISFNKKGDMIIDTGAYPLEKVRKFYGIKRDGEEFFTDGFGNKNYHSSLIVKDGGGVEGESYFVRIANGYDYYYGKERLIGISKGNSSDFKTEIYGFENNTNKIKIISHNSTQSYFGKITSSVFSINTYPDSTDSDYKYYMSYIEKNNNNFKLQTKEIHYYFYCYGDYWYNCNFVHEDLNTSHVATLEAAEQSMISCFFTEKKIYICLFTQKNNNLTIWVYEPNYKQNLTTTIYTFANVDKRRFYKGIYFRDEIGFFAYFKSNETFPTFSLYQYNEDKYVTSYKNYSIIKPSTGSFINNDMLNDLIKFNNNKLCFVSASNEKTILNVIVFSLYDNNNYMNVRYFFIDIWAKGIKLFADLKLGIYNNYLVMAFSHCDNNEVCEEGKYAYDHFSSLIYFGYANSTNNYLDIIDYIFLDNKNIQTDIIINFEKYLMIQNNLFGYVLKSTQILCISNEIKLLKNDGIININSTIDKGEKVKLNFTTNSGNYMKGAYKI